MSLLRRSAPVERARVAEPTPRRPDEGLALIDIAALRDEPDPDPLVEQAVDRMRSALASLEAYDEWGRALAWRQVARIALGPLVTELRDSQTTARLLDATRPPVPAALPADDVELFDDGETATRGETAETRLPTPAEMPFWPA
jgi:hypothetical protein